jgi:hypothetical protein
LRAAAGASDLEALRLHAEPDACEYGRRHVDRPLAPAPERAEQFDDLARHLAGRVTALQLTD